MISLVNIRARLALRAAIVLSVTAVASTVVSVPAYAATCPSGYLCFYKNANFAGGGEDRRTAGSDGNLDGDRWPYGGCQLNCSMNDNISSINNRHPTKDAAFYQHLQGGGNWLVALHGYAWSSLGGIGMNDKISSWCLGGSGAPVWCDV